MVQLQNGMGPSKRERLILDGFAVKHNLKVQLIQAKSLRLVFKLLAAGKADIAFGNLTITPKRKIKMLFSNPVAVTRLQLVASAKRKFNGLKSLNGNAIWAESGTSYWKILHKLKKDIEGVRLVKAPEGVDYEELIYRVGVGRIPFTIADDNGVKAYLRYRQDVRSVYTFPEKFYSAFAMGSDSNQLCEELNNYLKNRLIDFSEKVMQCNWDQIKRRGYIRMLTRNNHHTYYIHRGKLMGFEYELARQFAKMHNLELVVVVPPSWNDMFRYLKEGRGDFIAAGMTITEQRLKIPGISFATPYIRVWEMIIKHKGASGINSLEDLNGKRIAVRNGSVYHDSLLKLRRKGVNIIIKLISGNVETEQILEDVARGRHKYAMADDIIFKPWYGNDKRVARAFTLPQVKNYGWFVRAANGKLKSKINEFFGKCKRNGLLNNLKRKYFSSKRNNQYCPDETRANYISRYDTIIREFSTENSLPWTLTAAQIYQESRFDPRAVSWVGAEGLMQLMPTTANELGCKRPFNPRDNVKAGTLYMRRLKNRF
ncbi:MAG: transporter substrate-binding domain-containing protein [Lentisphaerae bacterium]|nr:transporter substrate-binding domain-containing protein [Lentisphaerota bacterium]MCP4101193.1 transporter substrate-binding domain-containing protein [Lentisphaerota bacterium]